MRIDIKPTELKTIINNYETQLALINELADRDGAVITNPVVDEMDSRLNNLKSMYEDLINDMKRLTYVDGINGLYKFCKLHDDMTMDDALDLLAELKYREGTLFDYER